MASSKPLRIAMIGQRGLPATFGGVERHVEELGARLVERGHEVTVYCRPNYTPDALSSYRGMRLVPSPTVATKHLDATVHSAVASLRTLASPPDVVHFHALGPGLFSPIPAYLSRSAVVQTVHGMDNERGKWGGAAQQVLSAGAWLAAHVPDATITVSRTLAARYAAAGGRGGIYIPNGAPRVAPRPVDEIERLFGLSRGGYVLWVGRIVPEKAVDHLVRAYREVRTDAKLVLVGGRSFTERYCAEVTSLASQDPRVLMADWQYGAVLDELFSNAALYVQPSLVEGLPLTLLEAAAFERPVVASDIGPHAEVIGESGPGRRLVPVDDEGALAAAIEHELGHPEDAAAGATLLQKQVRADYDWDDVADRTVEVYRSVTSPRAHRVRRLPAPRAPRGARSGTGVAASG